MQHKRAAWLSEGRPRGSDHSTYREYKEAKRAFRAVHRQTIDAFFTRTHEEIDRAACLDSDLFWRLFNRRRSKSRKEGNELNFNGTLLRDPVAIVQEWGTYFRIYILKSDLQQHRSV